MSVSVVLVERIITHPILLSGLTVISVYSGIVFHVKSYFENQTLKHTYVQGAVIDKIAMQCTVKHYSLCMTFFFFFFVFAKLKFTFLPEKSVDWKKMHYS